LDRLRIKIGSIIDDTSESDDINYLCIAMVRIDFYHYQLMRLASALTNYSVNKAFFYNMYFLFVLFMD